jgi:hypothetical protein
MPAFVRSCLAVLALLAAPGISHACQCADGVGAMGDASGPAKRMTHKELMEARLARASLVARGRVVSVSAGRDVTWPKGSAIGDNTASATIATARAVSADFEVNEAVKGEVAGTVKLLSGFGMGDCGLGGGFLAAVALDRDLIVELTPIASAPGHFSVGICSYLDMAAPTAPKPK